MGEIQTITKQTPIEIALGIGEDGKTTARKLYEFLEMDASNYSRWIKSNILENPFAEENTDYWVFVTNDENPKGKNSSSMTSLSEKPKTGRGNTQDFKLSANFAKKLSMQGKTERAEQAREYFIKVEDKLKETVTKGIVHNVKQLTITSREVAKIVGKTSATVLVLIRNRIEDLDSLGFTVGEFYIESTYHGGNNQDRPQFLLTERGCEDFSRCLEPDARKTFIDEFTDRFERMQAVIEGKPIKKPRKATESLTGANEGQEVIRLYKNNSWGILLIGNEVYNLTPDEIDDISRFVPEMQKYGISQIKKVLMAFLDSSNRSGKLEEVASWGTKEEKPQVPLLPDKATQKPKSDKDYNAPFITAKQAENRYNMCYGNIVKLAKESGAWLKYGKTARIDTKKMDEYLRKEYAE